MSIINIEGSIQYALNRSLLFLTQKEEEILQLISLGLNNSEIGEELHLSRHTIHTYRNQLLKKFDVSNVAGLIRKCFQLNVELPATSNNFGKTRLTNREKQILKMIAHEMSNREMANALNLSIHTINSYRQNLYSKLNVKTSAGLMRISFQNNLLNVAS